MATRLSMLIAAAFALGTMDASAQQNPTPPRNLHLKCHNNSYGREA